MVNSETLNVSDPYSRYSSEVSDNDIAVIIKIFIERKKTILFCCLVAVLLSLVYVAQLRVNYIATAKVMLKSVDVAKRSNILQTLMTTGKLDVADLLSQIQIMQSPEVIEALVIDQKLYKDPEFGGSDDIDDFKSLPPKRQRAIISIAGSMVNVSPILGTSIVDISVETRNPIKSADLANALARVYGENEETKTQEQAKVATQWLADRLEILREDVRKAEMALEGAREENNLTLSQSSDSRLTKIELLTREQSQAEAKYAETVATIEAIDNARKNGGRLDAISRFLSDRLMENLKGVEGGLLRKKAMLEKRYGPNHPEMIALQAEFNAFNEKMKSEVDTYILALKNQADIEKTQLDEIEKKIAEYRASYQGDSEHRLKIKNLQTQVSTSRTLLNNFMASYLESLQSLNIDKKPIRIIAQALPPSSSTVPNKFLITLLSGITGLFMGMFIALVMERIQDTIQTPRQIEKLLKLPVYAMLPKVKMGKEENSADYLLAHPASVLAELLRSLYTAIQLRDPHRKSGGRVITITSTHSGEGKTTNAVWLATTAALTGKKVLIIDADMRRPSLHKAYGLGNAKGLVDYLSDRLPLEDTIYKKHGSGVHVMTSKAIPTHALTLLTSERTENMFRRLRDMYDLIIVDVPTALVFSDARVMAKLSDKTLYIVEWKKTTRDDLKDSVKQFTDMNYNDLSFVLNKVEDKKIINFGAKDTLYLQQLEKE